MGKKTKRKNLTYAKVPKFNQAYFEYRHRRVTWHKLKHVRCMIQTMNKMTGSKAYLNIVFFLGVNNIIRFYQQVFADAA